VAPALRHDERVKGEESECRGIELVSAGRSPPGPLTVSAVERQGFPPWLQASRGHLPRIEMVNGSIVLRRAVDNVLGYLVAI
jgi:hypothetical protein